MKKEEKIYCVIVIVVLILVFFGDQIMLHFIPSDPNANNTTFGGDLKKEVWYDNPYAIKISLDEMLNKMQNKENFIVIFTRSNCQNCNELMAKDYLMKDISLPIYYVERDTYNENRTLVEQLANKEEKIKENIDLTPLIIKIKDGMIDSTILGIERDEAIQNFLAN